MEKEVKSSLPPEVKSKLPPIEHRLPKTLASKQDSLCGGHDMTTLPLNIRKAGDFRRRKPLAVQLAPLEQQGSVPDSLVLEVAGLAVGLVRSKHPQPAMPEAVKAKLDQTLDQTKVKGLQSIPEKTDNNCSSHVQCFDISSPTDSSEAALHFHIGTPKAEQPTSSLEVVDWTSWTSEEVSTDVDHHATLLKRRPDFPCLPELTRGFSACLSEQGCTSSQTCAHVQSLSSQSAGSQSNSMRSMVKQVLEDILVKDGDLSPSETDTDDNASLGNMGPGFPASPHLSDIEEEDEPSASSSAPLEDAHEDVSLKDKDEHMSPLENTTRSEHLTDLHDSERSCAVEESSGADELESTCAIEDTSSRDLSILDRLRERAAARFLAAAKSKELESALQVVRTLEVQETLVQKLSAPSSPPSAHGNAAEMQQTISEMPTEENTIGDNCSTLQTLRNQALLGIVAAARSGNLGSILNSSSGNPAPPKQLVPPAGKSVATFRRKYSHGSSKVSN